MWDYNEAFGLCCGFPITVRPPAANPQPPSSHNLQPMQLSQSHHQNSTQGWDRGGDSNGTSGGSAISPQVAGSIGVGGGCR